MSTVPEAQPQPDQQDAEQPAEQTEQPAPRRAPQPQPVVEATHLSLVGPEGPVFTDVSLRVEPHRLNVLVGPSGSGRSSLLLALCGRMGGSTGSLRADGRPVRSRRDLRALRARASVARVASFVLPEPRLSVDESIGERALIDAVRPAEALRAFVAAEGLLGVHLDRAALVEQLGAYDRTALAVALALVRPADLVVLDDVDAELSLDEQERFLSHLVRLAADGPAVLATSTEPRSVPADARLLTLVPPRKVS